MTGTGTRAAAAACLLAAAWPAAGGAADGGACIDRAAQELLEGVEEKGRREGGGAVRLAVTPFDLVGAPVDERAAGNVMQALEGALARAAGAGVEIKDRTSLGDLFSDLWRDEAFDAGYRERALRLLREARDIDAAAIGEWRYAGNDIGAGFRAVDVESGAVLAVSSGAGCSVASPPPLRLGLDEAVRRAAASLAEEAPDAAVLLTAGIRYRDTGARTEFSRLLQDRLVGALRERLGDAVTGRRLAARPLDGGGAAAADAALGEPGAYVLDGGYWVRPDRVEFSATLRNRRGSIATARETARRDAALDGVRLVPNGDFRFLTVNDGFGAFRFTLRTPQGRNPELAIGDDLRLVVRSDIDAWLSCYYWAQTDRGEYALYKIYPNRYTDEIVNGERRKGEGRGAISAKRRYVIPEEGKIIAGDTEAEDPNRFRLRIGPPAGAELVKCVATDRDVSGELPLDLGARGVVALPSGAAERLSQAFRDTGARVAEASVTINVVEGEEER